MSTTTPQQPKDEHQPQPQKPENGGNGAPSDGGKANGNYLHASCYCGAVRFRLNRDGAPPVMPIYCHCRECRRCHAAAIYSQFTVAAKDVEILKGEDNMTSYKTAKLLNGRHDRDTVFGTVPIFCLDRRFCTTCGTRMPFNAAVPKDLAVQFTLTTEDDERDMIPTVSFAHGFIEEFENYAAIPPEYRPAQHFYMSDSTMPWWNIHDGVEKHHTFTIRKDDVVLSKD